MMNKRKAAGLLLAVAVACLLVARSYQMVAKEVEIQRLTQELDRERMRAEQTLLAAQQERAAANSLRAYALQTMDQLTSKVELDSLKKTDLTESVKELLRRAAKKLEESEQKEIKEE